MNLVKRKNLFDLLIASFGGVLAGSAFSSNYWILLMPTSLMILWAFISKPFLGFIWASIAISIIHSWIWGLHPIYEINNSFKSLFLTLIIWIVISLFGGFLIWSWCSISKYFLNRNIIFINRNGSFIGVLILASLWGVAEDFLSRGPIFWIGIGDGLVQGDIYLAGLARWIGSSGLSFLTLVISYLMLKLVRQIFCENNKNYFIITSFILLISLLHFIGYSSFNLVNSKDIISAAIWQPNILIRDKVDQKSKKLFDLELIKNLETANKFNADILIAPEGNLPLNYELSIPSPIHFISGGLREVDNSIRSSLLEFLKGETKFSNYIDKFRLVPLGEKIPQIVKKYFLMDYRIQSLQSGLSSRLMELNELPSSVIAICYEISNGYSISKAVREGGQWIISIANLDPYPLKLQKQFLSLVKIRSIENQRDIIIAANTGPSGLVGQAADLGEIVEPNQKRVEFFDITFNRKLTFFTRFQNKPLLGIFVISLIYKIIKSNYLKKQFQ
tara:strand:+ start:11360 stop:12865 length:1506 start_codon:yes stop_codon:yes gene_type:complete